MPDGGVRTSLTGANSPLAYGNGVNVSFGPNSFYGPGQPLPPISGSDQQIRGWDFPVGFNTNTVPRHSEPFNFSNLRAFSNVELVRLAIETRKDQLEKLDWQIKGREDNKRIKESDARIEAIEKFLMKPDGITPFSSFMRQLDEDLLSIDAMSIELRRTRGGKLAALEIVPGDTINLLIDQQGRRPAGPNDLAFQQIIKGSVWANLTNRDLLYVPRNVRPGHVYGFSPVEQIIVTINTLIRRQASQLGYFTDGNIPAGYMSAPEGWTNQQIKDLQDWFDGKISGNQGEQRKIVWGPFGAKYQAFKDSPIKDEFDEWLARVVAFAFSLPPTPYIRQMNKGTAGEDQERALEEGLEPIKLHRKRWIDQLIATEFNAPDLEFVYAEERTIDAKLQMEIDDKGLRNGSLTIDEVRDRRGDDKLPNGLGEVPRVYLGAAVLPLDVIDELAQKGLEAQATATATQPQKEVQVGADVGPDGKPIAPKAGKNPPSGANSPPSGKGTAPKPDQKKNSKKSSISEFVSVELSKYSEDQERDDHGRFGAGGGGSKPSAVSLKEGLVNHDGSLTDQGVKTFASAWIVGSWSDFQATARDQINGVPREQGTAARIAEYADAHPDVTIGSNSDVRDSMNVARDLTNGVLDKINNSPPLEYPLYRGLVGVDYKVGDTFSESLSTWTSKEELAQNFAHDKFNTAGTDSHGKADGIVLKVSGENMHGFNITDLNPNNDVMPRFVQQAAEHITSGQYRVESVTGSGDKKEYNVVRVGPAQPSDLKKVIPVELAKYSPDQARDDHGRFGSGSGISLASKADLKPLMEKYASEPQEHVNIINMKVEGQSIFNPEQSLGLSREQMPQIPDDQRQAFLSEFHTELQNVDPSTLGPTQNQIDSYKVGLSVTGKLLGGTPIVSSDNKIIDGHHHWAGAVVQHQMDPSFRLQVYKVDAPRDVLMAKALAYDSAHGITGETMGESRRDKVMKAIAKYSPDQERDERGRFGSGGGTETVFRGVGGDSSKDGNYYTNDKEFARQFTQSGQDHEIVERQIPTSMVHSPSPLPSAMRPEQLDSAIEDAKQLGLKAVRVDEGEGQPNSIFVFDHSIFDSETKKYNPDQERDERGRFGSGGGSGETHVMFEVGPNPDNKDLSERWGKLSDSERQAVTDKISAEMTPQVLDAVGASGNVIPAIGGFEGDINPSLVLSVSNGDPFKIAGAIGDTFGQKAMVVMSDKPGPGLSKVGMVSVSVPGAGVEELRGLQGKIGNAAEGFTYSEGKMQILNFSGQSNSDFAHEIDNRLGNAYNVDHANVYSSYIEAKDYASPRSDSQGNAWKQTAGSLRSAFSQRLEEDLGQGKTGKVAKSDELAKAGFWTATQLRLDIDRPIALRSAKKLLGPVAKLLKKFGHKVSVLNDTYDTQQPGNWYQPDAIVDYITSLIELTEELKWIDVYTQIIEHFYVDTSQDAYESVGADASDGAFASIGVDNASDLVDRVEQRAADYARSRGEELVSTDGEQSFVSSTSRMVGKTIADGLERNIGRDAIAEELRNAYAFSAERALVIANNEIAMANSHAKMSAWQDVQATGATMVKQWYVSEDEGVCDECEGNAAQGEIDFDDVFESGDDMEPAHVNCRCVTTARVINPDGSESDDEEES